MIPHDKALHYIAGTLAGAASSLITNHWWCPLVSAALAGALKEGYDYMHRDKHTPDPWDFVATLAGGAPVALALL